MGVERKGKRKPQRETTATMRDREGQSGNTAGRSRKLLLDEASKLPTFCEYPYSTLVVVVHEEGKLSRELLFIMLLFTSIGTVVSG